jgi:hypothetical protein
MKDMSHYKAPPLQGKGWGGVCHASALLGKSPTPLRLGITDAKSHCPSPKEEGI